MSNIYGVVENVRYVMENDDLSDLIESDVVCVFFTRVEAELFIKDIYKLFKESDDWHEDLDETGEYHFKEYSHRAFSYDIRKIPLKLDARQVFDNLVRR